MRTIQMQRPPLNQPFNFKINARVDEAVEMLICMFERQRVRIREVRCNLKMQFSREAHERQLLPRSFANVVRLSLHCRFSFDNLQIGHLVIEGTALKVSNVWMYRASREVGIDVRPGRRMTVQFSSHAGTKDRKIGRGRLIGIYGMCCLMRGIWG
jgi:hypothetical protein